MFYNSNWFCYMTFLSAVWLLNTWLFQFLLEIGSWISWCYSFSGSFMKSVDNFLLWISFLDNLCRYLFKMMNIYAIDPEFDVKLWCTNTVPCFLYVLLLLLFLFLFLNKNCNYVTLVYMSTIFYCMYWTSVYCLCCFVL